MSDKNFWKNFGKLTPHPELGPKSEIKILGKNLENVEWVVNIYI
jgi:hypothetical protein